MLTTAKDIGRYILAILKGQYKNYRKINLFLIVIFIFYVLSPIDFVFDFILLWGWIDDAVIVRIAWYILNKELENFRKSEYYTITYQKVSQP
jgi:uncharacterized membrane protein YkvA (DUF1232 family)